MALVKANQQNELGDNMAEPCVQVKRFQVINQLGFFTCRPKSCTGMAGQNSYPWHPGPCEDKSTE